MDAAHIHLMLNHFPIAGLGFSIALIAIARWRESEELGEAGLTAVLLTGLITVATFLTGEPAEEIVEHLPGISEQFIKAHEEAAEKAVWVVGITALAALVGLIVTRKRKSSLRMALLLVTLMSLLSAGLLAWTNNFGGQIRHPEIRGTK